MKTLIVTESRYWYERYLKERGIERETTRQIWKQAQLTKIPFDDEARFVFINGSHRLEEDIIDVVGLNRTERDYLMNGVL